MRYSILLSLCLLIGCGKPTPPATPAPTTTTPPKRASWEDQPRDEKGRWISELTAYAKKHGITHEIAAAANTPFEQYIYDYSLSHGPKLDAKELHDYEAWKEFVSKKK